MRSAARILTASALVLGLSLTGALGAQAAPNAWDAPLTLSPLDTSTQDYRLLTHGPMTIAVWSTWSPGATVASLARSTDGGITWDPTRSFGLPGHDTSNVRMSSDGTTLTALWVSIDLVASVSSVLTSQSTDAVTWSTPTTLATGELGYYGTGLVRDAATLLATWSYTDEVFPVGERSLPSSSEPDPLERAVAEPDYISVHQSAVSTTGGASWSTAGELDNEGSYLGSSLVVGSTLLSIVSIADCTGVDPNITCVERITQLRSTDAGQTWQRTQLSIPGVDSYGVSLVRVGSTVVVEFEEQQQDTFRTVIRRSTDAGATWGASVTNGLDFTQRLWSDGTTLLAAGRMRSGDIYTGLHITRSTDGGATWSAPVTVSADQASEGDFAQQGNTIVVVWANGDDSSSTIMIAQSSDSGATWSTPTHVLTTTARSFWPTVVANGPTLTALWSTGGYEDQVSLVQLSSRTTVPPTPTVAPRAPVLAVTGTDELVNLGFGAGVLLLSGLLLAVRAARLRRD